MSSVRSDAELLDELEVLVLELMKRLSQRAETSKGDPVAADELFVLAGQAEAALSAASQHIRVIREMLDRSIRESS